jgi:nicotinate phosphoribosyltransferase
MREPSSFDPLRSALFTDLYELTMAQAYDLELMDEIAVFELIFRKLPDNRNAVIAAGLADVVASLENLQVTDDDLDYLRGLGLFREPFLERLKNLHFQGDLFAAPEGTPLFPHEPLVQVVAPLLEAQLIETLVLNQVHFQTVAATKATRIVQAAAGRDIVEFGSRRAHGSDAALKVVRTSYLAGAAGTSNVLAGKLYGIPVFGTMAHSYIQAHADESAAFAAFARLYPETTLLVDTYDTLEGVRKVIELSRQLGEQFRVHAVRLDSGDLGELAKQTRQMLDAAGLSRVGIFATSGLDEYEIARLLASGAPINAFGVGTKLAVSEDAPALDMAYKLVEYTGRPRMKLSSKKVILPGRKQVFRQFAGERMLRDIIGRHDEELEGEPLLQPVLRGGERLAAARVTLEEARRHAALEQTRLPDPLRRLERSPTPYPVEVSPALNRELESLRASLETARRHG